jgi:hypothetical protein
MTGLSADQGESTVESIADIAATEARWSKREKQLQLEALRQYNKRLRTFGSDASRS